MAQAPSALPAVVGPQTPTDQAISIADWIDALRTRGSATTAPTSPVTDQLWLDTSATPNLLKVWNGFAWVPFSIDGLNGEVRVINTDWNAIDVTNFFRSTLTTTPNTPTAQANWHVQHIQGNSNTAIQYAFLAGFDQIQLRRKASGVWQPWVRIYPLADYGSNANGTFIKYNDGRLVCQHRITDSFPINITAGSMFRSARATWTYPEAFVVGSNVTFVELLNNSTSEFAFGCLDTQPAPGLSASFFALSPTSLGSLSREWLLQASGRWY